MAKGCGCGCGEESTNNDDFFMQAEGQGQGPAGGGVDASQEEDQGLQLAGFNLWLILLFVGAAFTILNWDTNAK